MKEIRVNRVAVLKEEENAELFKYALAVEFALTEGVITEHPHKLKEFLKETLQTDNLVVVQTLLQDTGNTIVGVELDHEEDGKIYVIKSTEIKGGSNYVVVEELEGNGI